MYLVTLISLVIYIQVISHCIFSLNKEVVLESLLEPLFAVSNL